jgi:hypothetical protein
MVESWIGQLYYGHHTRIQLKLEEKIAIFLPPTITKCNGHHKPILLQFIVANFPAISKEGTLKDNILL